MAPFLFFPPQLPRPQTVANPFSRHAGFPLFPFPPPLPVFIAVRHATLPLFSFRSSGFRPEVFHHQFTHAATAAFLSPLPSNRKQQFFPLSFTSCNISLTQTLRTRENMCSPHPLLSPFFRPAFRAISLSLFPPSFFCGCLAA